MTELKPTGARTEYRWIGGTPAHNHSFLAPAVLAALSHRPGASVLDLGCGNGSLTARIQDAGYRVVGAESSASGLDAARRAFPAIEFVEHDLAQPLPDELRNRFDVVLAAEVIEHLFLPRCLFARAREALLPGGELVVTTPYHGWLKNVALAVTNKMDSHWSPGWDYGHIKFFSVKTLGGLAVECAFEPTRWTFAGRWKPVAKSMLMTARATKGSQP
jgi:2-polyprenyl-3-methyl-5-hydroxy-6-metoxy-1,4-benzoquinol methylase